jgi:chemotaxis protein MotB
MNLRLSGAALLLAVAFAPTACVSSREHHQALAALQRARVQSADLGRRVTALEADVARLTADVQQRDARLADDATTQADLNRKVDDLTVMNAELAERLRKAGQSVEALATERGSLNDALAKTRAKLEELSRLQAAAEARAAQFRELSAKLKRLVDAGQLEVVSRNGRLLIQLPNDVLFDSGKTDIKPAGRGAIGEVAAVLRTLADRKFQVLGHTDNVAIQSARFPSNWELSTARAVEVVRLLIAGGMNPKNLTAAGQGEFDPVAANDAPEGRAKNRRIEIALVPNLDELVAVPPETPKPAEPAKSAPAKR